MGARDIVSNITLPARVHQVCIPSPSVGDSVGAVWIATISRIIPAIPVKIRRITAETDRVGLQEAVESGRVEAVAIVVEAQLLIILAPGKEEPVVVG